MYDRFQPSLEGPVIHHAHSIDQARRQGGGALAPPFQTEIYKQHVNGAFL